MFCIHINRYHLTHGPMNNDPAFGELELNVVN